MKIKPINSRVIFAIIYDCIASFVAWYAAFLLRFNFELSSESFTLMKQMLLFVIPLQFISYVIFGLYRGAWRFTSLLDLKKILIAVFISSILLAALLHITNFIYGIPRSVLVINPILLIVIMGGGRFIFRVIKDFKIYGMNIKNSKPAIILASADISIPLIKNLAQTSEWRVVGLLNNDKTMWGREVLGVKVYGDIANLSKVVFQFDVHHLIIAIPSTDYKLRRKALELSSKLDVQVLILPSIEDLMNGRNIISNLRRVNIEDLLGRDEANLNNSEIRSLITENSIFVSGAGGSIGSELCRHILKFNPSHLICFDISEYSLYQLDQELRGYDSSVEIVFIVGDVKNETRLNNLLAKYQPKVVFHAAAYKHVPLMETNNVSEAFSNNVLGTYILAKASKKAKVERFILVSSDKAVNPTNVMGATKRLAEMVCQGLQDEKSTHFMIVRFGNVLGSSGSVIPKFQKQIEAGGPITVTHPAITRFFMSINEAAQLVIQAGLTGRGGEVFVLDMGEPVRIVDLAKDMIRLSGLHEDEIAIHFVGLRPGEKLYEELLADSEHTLPTTHKKIRIASANRVDRAWINSMLDWVATTLEKDEDIVKKELKKWVKEYVMNKA
jgi:FlaA1/EpsC-like NDP-sugar epimerase